MRLWSIHPSYLDAKGLVALWREGLLAKHVLLGKTKGYTHHPQLIRFQKLKNPVRGIDAYLSAVVDESIARGYHFDATKVKRTKQSSPIPVTRGQMKYEELHLRKKLKVRDPKRLKTLPKKLKPHPSFKEVAGPIEVWEKV